MLILSMTCANKAKIIEMCGHLVGRAGVFLPGFVNSSGENTEGGKQILWGWDLLDRR